MSFHGTSLKKINNLKTAAKPITDQARQQLKRPYPTASSSSSNAAAKNAPQKRISRTPIIIIPASGTALISMYNAKDILQRQKEFDEELLRKKLKDKKRTQTIARINESENLLKFLLVDEAIRIEWEKEQ